MGVNTELRGLNFEEGYIAVIDKPLDWTSADVVRKIKYSLRRCGYRRIKVGHAGTLDPLATGILIVCIGRATKLVEKIQAEEKEYEATVRFGATTASFDREHTVDHTYPYRHITLPQLEAAVQNLTGERLQTPPLYSAKKVEGLHAYDIARAGETVELKQSLINIYEMTIRSFELPEMQLHVRCSKGTYIRALAGEIGEAVGSGAHLTALRRTRSGGFTIEHSWNLYEFLEKLKKLETK